MGGYRILRYRSFRVFVSLLIPCALCLVPVASSAEITVEDNSVIFTQQRPQAGDAEIVKRVTAFEEELVTEKLSQALPLSLLPNLKRTIIQGVKFAVPPSRRFAVILSYVCSQQLLAAEIPYSCDSCAVVVDPEGYVTQRLRGNFLWIVPHESLPYFALIEDYCCDTIGRAHLYDLSGQEICIGYLDKEPAFLTGSRFTCGATWENGVLVDKKEIPLKDQ